MASKVKMFLARHPQAGIVSADDVYVDPSLRDNLVCRYCKVPVSFVGQYIRQDVLVPSHFRLKRGYLNHWSVEGQECKYNKESDEETQMAESKVMGGKIEKDLVCRINIPVWLNSKIKKLLEEDYVSQEVISDKNGKRAPGYYNKSGKELSDYINSAKALAKLANEYWPHNKQVLQLVKFKFQGVTANWSDFYYESWDEVYHKFPSKKPKQILCLRGVFKSISRTFIENGEEWIVIRLKKHSISTKQYSKTFASIKLYKPMFRILIEQLYKYQEQGIPIEITFFGNIERTIHDGNPNIIGIAYVRKQLHIQPITIK